MQRVKVLANPFKYTGDPISEIIINGFLTVNQFWIVTGWNKAAEQLLGIHAADIIGKNLWEEFVGIMPLTFYHLSDKAFIFRDPVTFREYWAKTGNWFDITLYPSAQSLSVSFKSAYQDNKSDSYLQRLEKINTLYRFVAEVTNDCLWEWDLLTNELTWIDGGHKRVFGYAVENTMVPRSFWESCLHPDDKARIVQKFNTVAREEKDFILEEDYRFKRSSGEYAYVHDRSCIIYENDVAVRIIGSTRDITERKIAELALLESEKNVSLIAKETFNAVIITDKLGRIVWVNSAFTRITEYELQEVMGKIPGHFLQGKETDRKTVDYLRKQIKNKEPYDCEIINYSKSGRKYWIHIQGQALFDDKGNNEQYFAIQEDITEKKAFNEKVIQERVLRQIDITNAVLTAQEQERAEIGKELHDNVNQILGATRLYIEMAKAEQDNRTLYLDKSSAYILMVIEEIRRISKTMIPLAMSSDDMFESINVLVEDINLAHGVTVRFENEITEKNDIDEKMQLNVFRIIQEQLNNILKHAEAMLAIINLSRNKKRLVLIISDDGRGCHIATSNPGVGIRNIISRAELYGGSVRIISEPGEGYVLKVEMIIQ